MKDCERCLLNLHVSEHTFYSPFLTKSCFFLEHGHVDVPQRYPGLGEWVHHIRARRSKMKPENKEKLEALGFKWITRKPPTKRPRRSEEVDRPRNHDNDDNDDDKDEEEESSEDEEQRQEYFHPHPHHPQHHPIQVPMQQQPPQPNLAHLRFPYERQAHFGSFPVPAHRWV